MLEEALDNLHSSSPIRKNFDCNDIVTAYWILNIIGNEFNIHTITAMI